MSGSSNLNSFRDRRQVVVQFVSCGVLPPGLAQDCSQHSCVIAVYWMNIWVNRHHKCWAGHPGTTEQRTNCIRFSPIKEISLASLLLPRRFKRAAILGDESSDFYNLYWRNFHSLSNIYMLSDLLKKMFRHSFEYDNLSRLKNPS